MTPDDYASVAGLLRRNGLAVKGREDWLHLWRANPFRDTAACMGWVLEDEGGNTVGTFGNLPLGYEWNGSPVRVAAAHAWAVDPAFRRDSIGLLRRYVRQPAVDLLLTSTASGRVGEIFSAVRFRPVPHANYDRALFWVTNPRGFAEGALRQLGVPLAGSLAAPAGLALGALDRLSGWRRAWEPSKAVRLSRFDGRFDAFWGRLRGTPDRLLAVRSAAVLSWHFASALKRRELAILALEEAGSLSGYLVMFRHDHPAVGLTRYRVADLQVLGDPRSGARHLMLGALELAAEEGIDAVEVVGLDARKREALSALSPRRRRLASWLFYYRPLQPRLASCLGPASAWDPCPYDGDASV
jgi:hypothetical protein